MRAVAAQLEAGPEEGRHEVVGLIHRLVGPLADADLVSESRRRIEALVQRAVADDDAPAQLQRVIDFALTAVSDLAEGLDQVDLRRVLEHAVAQMRSEPGPGVPAP